MARSGGTLISKCIGSMNGVALLSEVHPFTSSGQFNPLQQANDWLGVDVQEELRAIAKTQGTTWLEAICLIHRCVEAQGRRLIVRDWSHLDFTGVPWIEPSYKTTTAEVLARNFKINQAFTVRHPIDQWISLSKLEVIAGKLHIATFMKGYRAFAEAAAKTDFTRYEDFTTEPETEVKKISSNLGIEYDEHFLHNWSQFTKITGDVPKVGEGRGTESMKIEPLKPYTPTSKMRKAFENSPDYFPSLEALGYSAY